MGLPTDYEACVYAGWLGKCIGVRFGAPLENWTYEEIRDHLGEVTTYLREAPGKVFKPDDDTSVPMIFIRALEDHGPSPTPQQIADTWMNYLGDQHGTLWWGGYGISTEHTVYQNLRAGIPVPRAGSIRQNGAALAEQIGGQIFSDIWGLVAPNDPALAAELAARASSVTHDGSGIDGGRFIAALVSRAFSENDPHRLIECGLEHISPDGAYARVIRAMVEFHQAYPENWRDAFAYLKANFGYDRYSGVVHIIPNAGVVALGLLYGEGDFSRSLQISNMAGWDTDCNVGNVGAIMGTAVGLAGIESHWREPMNDLLVASSIIGTRNLLTIPQCADLFASLGRRLQSETSELRPRYHFMYAGSTNNFEGRGELIHMRRSEQGQTLQAAIRKLTKKSEARIFTQTYYRPHELSSNYYEACFTPLIHPGQTIEARVYLPEGSPDTILAAPYVWDDNHHKSHQAAGELLIPGEWCVLRYDIPPMKDVCFSEVGVVLRNIGAVWEAGSFQLAELDWSGTPDYECSFAMERAESGGISQWTRLRGYWRLENGGYHGSGVGICETYSGDIRWADYTLEARLIPLIGEHHHILVRVGGASHSYAFGLAPDQQVVLYKKDKTHQVVAAAPFKWSHETTYHLSLTCQNNTLTATIAAPDGQSQASTWQDTKSPYLNGQIGLSTWQGSHTRFEWIRVRPNGTFT